MLDCAGILLEKLLKFRLNVAVENAEKQYGLRAGRSTRENFAVPAYLMKICKVTHGIVSLFPIRTKNEGVKDQFLALTCGK